MKISPNLQLGKYTPPEVTALDIVIEAGFTASNESFGDNTEQDPWLTE